MPQVGETPGSRQGHMWVYRDAEGDAVYDFTWSENCANRSYVHNSKSATRTVKLRVSKPAASGAKTTNQGQHTKQGVASAETPLRLEFRADREGDYQLAAKLTDGTASPTRAYLKVEYEAPPVSQKF